mgnify:CR=1 FL=1
MSSDLLTEETREINENIQLQNIDDNSTDNPIDHGWIANTRDIWYRPFEVIDISQPNNIFNEGDNRAIGLSCEREKDPINPNSKIYMKLTKLKYIKMPIEFKINPHSYSYNYDIDLTPTLNDFQHRFIFKKIEIDNHHSEEKDKYTLIYKNYKPEFQEGEERSIKDEFILKGDYIEQEKILQKHKDKLYIKKQQRKSKKANLISGGDQPPPQLDTVVTEKLIEEKPADELQHDDYILWAISFNGNVTDYIELYDFTKLILEQDKILDKKAGPSRNMHLLKLPKDAYTEDEICVSERRGPDYWPIMEGQQQHQTLIHWAIGTYMKVLNTIFGVPLTYMKVMTKAEGGDKVTLEEVEKTNVYYNFVLTTDTNFGEGFRGIGFDQDKGKMSNVATGEIYGVNVNVGTDLGVIDQLVNVTNTDWIKDSSSFSQSKSRSINTEWLERMRNPTLDEDDNDDAGEEITGKFGGKKRKSRKSRKSKKSKKSKKPKRKTTKRKSRKSKR